MRGGAIPYLGNAIPPNDFWIFSLICCEIERQAAETRKLTALAVSPAPSSPDASAVSNYRNSPYRERYLYEA